jgi:transcriptional regulator with GAF, ATPase, and Fis domain
MTTHAATDLESAIRLAEAACAETEVLSKALLTLTQNLRMDELLDTLLGCLQDIVPFDSAQVLLTEDANALLVARELPKPTGNRVVVTLDVNDNPLLQRVVVMKKSIYVANTQSEPDWREMKPFAHAHSWIGLPLVVSETVNGVLSITSSHAQAFTPEHFRLAKLLAIPMAVAIYIARLREWVHIYAEEREELLKRAEQARMH